jgi:hypothetical protein
MTPKTTPPRINLERELVRIWEQVFRHEPIGVREAFFDLGGTSGQAVRIFAQIDETFHKRLAISVIIGAPTGIGVLWSQLVPEIKLGVPVRPPSDSGESRLMQRLHEGPMNEGPLAFSITQCPFPGLRASSSQADRLGNLELCYETKEPKRAGASGRYDWPPSAPSKGQR